MVAVLVVFRNVIDDYGPTAVTNFVADRGFDTELCPRQQSKGDLVANCARNPTVLRYSCHSGEAHPRRAANDFENGRNGIDARDCGDVSCQGAVQQGNRHWRSWRNYLATRDGPIIIDCGCEHYGFFLHPYDCAPGGWQHGPSLSHRL